MFQLHVLKICRLRPEQWIFSSWNCQSVLRLLRVYSEVSIPTWSCQSAHIRDAYGKKEKHLSPEEENVEDLIPGGVLAVASSQACFLDVCSRDSGPRLCSTQHESAAPSSTSNSISPDTLVFKSGSMSPFSMQSQNPLPFWWKTRMASTARGKHVEHLTSKKCKNCKIC